MVLHGLQILTTKLVAARCDTVTWTNNDTVPHTVTAGSGRWDSGNIAAHARWTRVLAAGDTGQYFCRYLPTMRASSASR